MTIRDARPHVERVAETLEGLGVEREAAWQTAITLLRRLINLGNLPSTKALDLMERDARVLELSQKIKDRPVECIAKRMGVNRSTVYRAVHRARKHKQAA